MAIAVMAAFVILIAALAVLLVRTADDGSTPRPTTATTGPSRSPTAVTLRPAPPTLRLGPVQPDLAR